MIRTKSIEDQLRRGRLDAKTLDSMFRRQIEEGANCSPFVSKAILAAVKEVFPIGPEEADHQLGFEKVHEFDPDTGKSTDIGWRRGRRWPDWRWHC